MLTATAYSHARCRGGVLLANAQTCALLACAVLLASCATEDAAPTTEASIKKVTFADEYPVTAQFPEGGVYDAAAGVFYVGSLKDGSVHRIDASSKVDTEIFKETAAGTWWTLGMAVDTANKRLWVCAMDDRKPGPRAGHVWVFDLVTDKRIANHALSAAAKDATCTDVAVTKDGVGYVVDRENPVVYRVDVTNGPKVFASDPLLKGTIAGQNGVVVLPGEAALLVIVYTPPSLARVSLSDGKVSRVELSGPFKDDKALLAGADGLAFADGKAYVAFSSKVMTVTPASDQWAKATSTAVDVKEGLTDVISTPGGLYVLNGQAVRFALNQATDPFLLKRFP